MSPFLSCGAWFEFASSQNRTCDLHYASLDSVAHHVSAAHDDAAVAQQYSRGNKVAPGLTAPARQSHSSTAARLPLGLHVDNDFNCWEQDDAAVSSAPHHATLRLNRRMQSTCPCRL